MAAASQKIFSKNLVTADFQPIDPPTDIMESTDSFLNS
jgi:hypothetical protein